MSSSHRLLIVTESLAYGGTESHLVRTLPHLVSRGWDIRVFCLTRRGDRADALERYGIKVLGLMPQTTRSKRSHFAYPLHLGRASLKLYGLMHRWRPRIAHFYLPAPYLIGAPVAIAAGVPVKVMSRRSLSDYQKRWPGAAAIERRLHRHMSRIVGNCQVVVEQLIQEGVPKSKTHLIYNGIDCTGPKNDRAAARAKLGLCEDTLVGIMVANLIPYKGHHDLIEGMAGVAAQLPPSWQILCAGSGDEYQAELQARISAHGLDGHIRLLGLRTDVADLLAAADYGILPSRANEGLSNAILESMVAALPMIVTDIGGNAEVVVNGETGFVVPPANPRALGLAVLRLAQDAGLRHHFGRCGRTRVCELFTLEACVDAHDILYKELARNTTPI